VAEGAPCAGEIRFLQLNNLKLIAGLQASPAASGRSREEKPVSNAPARGALAGVESSFQVCKTDVG